MRCTDQLFVPTPPPHRIRLPDGEQGTTGNRGMWLWGGTGDWRVGTGWVGAVGGGGLVRGTRWVGAVGRDWGLVRGTVWVAAGMGLASRQKEEESEDKILKKSYPRSPSSHHSIFLFLFATKLLRGLFI